MSNRFQQRSKLTYLLALAVLVAAAGCGGGGGDAGPSSPTAPEPAGGGGSGSAGSTGGTAGGSGGGTVPAATTGRLTLLLTDNPIDEIDKLVVNIVELKVKPAQQPVQRIPSSIGMVDLLTLQGGVTELLGQGEVEAGTYQFIEMLLGEGSYVVETATGDELPLKVPSEKIKVAGGPFEVLADFTTSVTVDFDAEKSLKKTGNGRYQLKPHVTITAVSLASGS